MKASIHVRLKGGVLDPQGKAIEQALHTLGFENVHNVRQGKLLELEVDEADRDKARGKIDDMCRKLLANPVIEDYDIEFDGEGA